MKSNTILIMGKMQRTSAIEKIASAAEVQIEASAALAVATTETPSTGQVTQIMARPKASTSVTL